MADLAKVENRTGARQRGTQNRDFVLPARRDTDAPSLEVNAQINGKNQSEAQKLASILGIAEDAGQAAVALANVNDAKRRDETRAQATIDSETGQPSDRLNRSEVYTQAFYAAEGSREAAQMDAAVTMAVNERLANTDDPATPEDIAELIEQQFRAGIVSEDGTLQPMHPAKQRALAAQMAATRARIIGPALRAIQDQTNTRYADNVAFDIIRNGVPEIGYVAAPAARVPTALEAIDPDVAFVEPEGTAAATAAAPMVTGRLPIQGTVTSNFAAHTRRGSPGLDIDGRKGDPVELPASGRVIDAGYNSRAGNFVIVDHGNGVVSSYSHLDKRYVTRGDTITAGSQLGTVGNTGNVRSRGGDGSHLHYRVKVNGRDVDPASFQFDGIAPEAAGEARPANLEIVEALDETSQANSPALDFEVIMQRRPPSMSPKEWKDKIIPALILHAEVEGRPEILDGLWQSVREDGTPSFNPAEIGAIRDAATQIRTKIRTERNRQQTELWGKNQDEVLDAFSRGEDVSITTLNELGEKGLIDPKFRYSMIEGIRQEQEQEVRYQDSLEREAEREAKADRAMSVAGIIAARSMGLDLDEQDDYKLWQSGALGTGAEGISNFRQIRAAAERGRTFRMEQPEYVNAAEILRREFPQARGSGGGLLDELLLQGTGQASSQALALSIFKRMVGEGKSPAEAIAGTRLEMRKYAPKPRSADDELAEINRLLNQ